MLPVGSLNLFKARKKSATRQGEGNRCGSKEGVRTAEWGFGFYMLNHNPPTNSLNLRRLERSHGNLLLETRDSEHDSQVSRCLSVLQPADDLYAAGKPVLGGYDWVQSHEWDWLTIVSPFQVALLNELCTWVTEIGWLRLFWRRVVPRESSGWTSDRTGTKEDSYQTLVNFPPSLSATTGTNRTWY